MNTTSTQTTKATSKPAGLILFALMIVAAVLIVFTAMSDGTTNTVTAATSFAKATQAARCGMDEKTYGHTSPLMQMGVEQQCNAPAEVQP